MGWSVAVIRSNSHVIAADNLARQGFTFYNPQIARKVRTRHLWYETRLLPLFPGYMFVGVKDQWRSLLSTIGVLGVIMQAGRPAVVADEVVTRIRSREVDGVFRPMKFAPGQKVRIESGPFSLETGIYEGMRGKDRAAVLLSVLGSVVVREDNLSAA